MVIHRRAARALLVADRSLLLIAGCDPGRPELGSWWLTPGGGIEEGESIEAAAVREIHEETGLDLTIDQLGPIIATRLAEFEFEREHFLQREWFFAVRVARFAPHARGWDDVEQRALLDHRWWTLDELDATDDQLYPSELAAVFRSVLDGPIDAPLELSGA